MAVSGQAWLLREVKEYIGPFLVAQSDTELRRLLAQLGWNDLAVTNETLGKISDLLNELRELATALPTEALSLEAAVNALRASQQLTKLIGRLSDTLATLEPDSALHSQELLSDLLSFLLIRTLVVHHPRLLSALILLGAIQQPRRDPSFIKNPDGRIIRLASARARLDFDRLIELARDPLAAVREYYWRGSLQDSMQAREFSDRLFAPLSAFAATFGFESRYGISALDRAKFSTEAEFELARRTLHLLSPAHAVRLAVAVVPLSDGGPFLSIKPTGLVDLNTTIGEWSFIVEVGGELPELQINAQRIAVPDQEAASVQVRATATFLRDEPAFVLGSDAGTRLEVGRLRFQVFIDSEESDYGFEVDSANCSFVLAASDIDGFLAGILPKNGARADFSLRFSYSRQRGVRLCGSLGIDIDLPLGFSLGGQVALTSLLLGVRGEDDAISAVVGISAVARLGPIVASVERVGMELSYARGDAADDRLTFGFLPPSGARLSVAAGAVSGGGFVVYNAALSRYSGVLDLKFADIALIAIGVITTKLPGDRDRYALFINIGVTFSPPVTLPYNFFVVGCGGLLALNRTMDVEALRCGLRNRTLDSLLFPADPILNATRIISDSERVFPVEEGRFIVGPMVKLGWGSNGLLVANLAVIIELPDPIVIAILGQLTATFPKADKAVVVLHLDVLGVLDFGKKSLGIDATLYDSRILAYDLYGDAALRLSWGARPVFALSIGGFHPKFPTPENFPSLRRVTLQLRSTSSFDLSCTVYQALTSNTLQLGAGLRLHAEACGAALDGRLSFDGMVCWSPFEFEINIAGSLSASYEGYDIASIRVSLDLSGPTPWSAKGKAKVSVLCFSVTARFNVKWGDDEKRREPAIDPLVDFEPELALASNWGSGLLQRRPAVESLRSLQADATSPAKDAEAPPAPDLYAHPAGAIEWRQRLLPLGLKLRMYAHADVKDHFKFDVTLTLGEQGMPTAGQFEATDVEEYFALELFKGSDAAALLSKPSYELWKAGMRIAPRVPRIEGTPSKCELEYESILIKADGTSQQPKYPLSKWSALGRTIRVTALRRASLRDRGPGKFRVETAPRVKVKEEPFAIVNAATLASVTDSSLVSNRPLTQTRAEDLVDAAVAAGRVEVGSVAVVPQCETEVA